jgi:hypothetical protein
LRNSGSAIAVAVDNNATVSSLANQVGLNPGQYQRWLGSAAPEFGVPESSDTPVGAGTAYTVPNTLVTYQQTRNAYLAGNLIYTPEFATSTYGWLMSPLKTVEDTYSSAGYQVAA